ncbi:MAG: hypothetical protein ABI616_11715 [Pseudomonadota bacterium]
MKSACFPTAATVLAVLLLPTAVSAQTADEWQFQAAIYLYLLSVGVKNTFPEPGGDVSIDILDSLKMTFMGNLEARKGRWGALTDFIYLDLGNTITEKRDNTIGATPLPDAAAASVGIDLKGISWTIAGTYRAVQDEAMSLDLIAGARLFDIKQRVDWQLSGSIGSIPLPGRTGNVEVNLTNWDAIVGVKGRFGLGAGKWFIPWYADVGTGDSDLTWQLMAGVGYAFRWGEVVGAWRHIDYDMKASSELNGISFDGPAVAAVFHW